LTGSGENFALSICAFMVWVRIIPLFSFVSGKILCNNISFKNLLSGSSKIFSYLLTASIPLHLTIPIKPGTILIDFSCGPLHRYQAAGPHVQRGCRFSAFLFRHVHPLLPGFRARWYNHLSSPTKIITQSNMCRLPGLFTRREQLSLH
jgi:hypothetical protein